MAIKCGNCKKNHASVEEVRSCYGKKTSGQNKSLPRKKKPGTRKNNKTSQGISSNASKRAQERKAKIVRETSWIKIPPKGRPPDYANKSTSHLSKSLSSPKPSKKTTGKKHGPADNPLAPSYPKQSRSKGASNPGPRGSYLMPRTRATPHSGKRCKWCNGPLGLCACD